MEVHGDVLRVTSCSPLLRGCFFILPGDQTMYHDWLKDRNSLPV